jgi:hypothetical protein
MKRRFQGHARKKKKRSSPRDALAKTVQQIEDRQRQLEQALNNFDQHHDLLEAETIQEIVRQNALCYENLLDIMEETSSHMDESLTLISQRFAEELQQDREQYNNHLESLFQRFDLQEQQEHIKAEAAQYWLRQAAVMASFIQEQFDHDRFLPGRLSPILRNLELAQNNLAEGFLESSLQCSQQSFLQLSDLHFELEQRILEWQTEYENAYDALEQFLAELELNARVCAFGLDGEELAAQVDLAYWSNGAYPQLVDKCRNLLSVLSHDQQYISTEELRRTHAELIPVVTSSFESIIYQARLNALNSQLRMNIAERALQALEIQGFTMNDSGYVNQDMRAPFLVQLGNEDGCQVTIQVLPGEQSGQELTNELVMITNHRHIRTEQEARMQWQELSRSLQEFNLRVSALEVRNSSPQPISNPVLQKLPRKTQLIQTERQNDVR